ncbi:PulJ/GspJ family protein [Cellulomonas soli]|uniref:PulJ/GspJ family protein n=1 Tax=Cellulomonas soli TaxID=931535 RepID=UPI003F839122
MRDARTTRARDDAGYTLTELLVAMGVFSVVIALATSGLISLLTTTRGATDRADAQAEIRLGLADIGKQMRSGNVLFSPKDEPGYVPSCQSAADGSDTGTCMRIYTQTFGTPRCVQWQVLQVEPGGGGAQLRTRSWSIDWQTTGDVSDWRTVARGLSLDAGHLPFTLQGAATPYDRRLLEITLLAHDDDKDRDVSIESSISGRNTSYGYDTGQCVPVPAE